MFLLFRALIGPLVARVRPASTETTIKVGLGHSKSKMMVVDKI